MRPTGSLLCEMARSLSRRAAPVLASLALLATTLPASAQEDALVELTSQCEHTHAVVLVGGYGQDWRYFEPWVEQLTEQGACVFGFTSDHTQDPMPKTSESLWAALRSLQGRAFEKTTILAHSMGGLVARHALARATEGELTAPVVLHAYGTPWGGFFWANFARWTPFAEAMTRAMRVPMSTDIGTSAQFMRSLRAPLPEGVRLVVHHSVDDETARPETADAREGFAWALGVASEVRAYREVGHSDFVMLPAELF